MTIVAVDVQKKPFSKAERVLLLVTRSLNTALLTALVGAIENWFFERFFAPNLYATGPPIARGVFALVWSFPFILVGLVVLGLPIAYSLARMRAESGLAYVLAGALAGTLWGAVAIGLVTTYGIGVSAFYGGVCALLWWWLRPRS